MNWDEIAAKWAAMARRAQSELPTGSQRTGPEEDPPEIPPGDLPEPALPENELFVPS